MSKDLVTDILLQMQEQQQADSRVLHEMKGNIDVRVKKLEDAQRLNWWMTYVVTPAFMLAHAVARQFGVRV
jgi:hypothetical protein